jgi:hypothetical protein
MGTVPNTQFSLLSATMQLDFISSLALLVPMQRSQSRFSLVRVTTPTQRPSPTLLNLMTLCAGRAADENLLTTYEPHSVHALRLLACTPFPCLLNLEVDITRTKYLLLASDKKRLITTKSRRLGDKTPFPNLNRAQAFSTPFPRTINIAIHSQKSW